MNTAKAAKEIFLQALDEPELKREAFLRTACATPELRVQVESLLDAHARAGGFLSGTPVGGPELWRQTPGGPARQVGPYQLLDRLGEGGFGVVYMAQQLAPIRRMVALKVVKLGMDTAQVVERFKGERQTLALMDHPNIATVFDAGVTESGRPYFVMELVLGDPITAYCDQNRLSVEDRVRLFVRVCRAVQHAHQKGVIHRDLKPANILVTTRDGQPTPKVIDFGIAKAIGAGDVRSPGAAALTLQGQPLGTPRYMSPEQACASGLISTGASAGPHDVDTRADVYALGVVLFELLTGSTPLDDPTAGTPATPEEALRRLATTAGPQAAGASVRPSSRVTTISASPEGVKLAAARATDPARLRSRLRGDLDWIALKALEPDRERRYASADALADDLERALEHRAVLASPPSLTRGLRAFVRRRRGTVAMVLAALVVILGTTALLAWVAVNLRDERARLIHERDEARQELERVRAERSTGAMTPSAAPPQMGRERPLNE